MKTTVNITYFRNGSIRVTEAGLTPFSGMLAATEVAYDVEYLPVRRVTSESRIITDPVVINDERYIEVYRTVNVQGIGTESAPVITPVIADIVFAQARLRAAQTI